jgi:hypothetical protein
MVLTALLNKIKYRDPTVMPAWEVLRMATVEGAHAIGIRMAHNRTNQSRLGRGRVLRCRWHTFQNTLR